MKLKTKFSLLISTLVLLIVSGVTVFLLIAESRFLIREMEHSRTTMVKSLAQVAGESMIVKDDILILNYLKLLKNTKGLLYASVTDTGGKVLAHTDMNLLWTTLSDSVSAEAQRADRLLAQKYTNDRAVQVLELALPVLINEQKAGVARIGFSREALNRAVEESLATVRRRILIVGVAALSIGLLGALILTRMMTNPIRKIAEGAGVIGSGKLNHKIEVKSKDELGDLAREFNLMSDKLKELDHMKSDFVSSVTHELRSPLISLKMYIDLFLKGTAGAVNDKQREYLQIMRDSSVRLSRFIDDLLDMAKIERGKMQIVIQAFDLPAVMKEIEQLFRPQVDHKQIRFDVSVQEGLPQVLADPERTRQVLINLISNAVKFTPENGRIAVEAKRLGTDQQVEIAVRDSGIGIPADQLNRIFDKFEQVKDVRNNVAGPKGTGLGLSIVKGILEMQGGRIRVESELNKGSSFIVSLPLSA